MNRPALSINPDRLIERLNRLGEKGALSGGGCCRLALSDEDRQGRDLVVGWMRELGLKVSIDGIGNVMGLRPGSEDGPPVMVGSHIDTVRTGGLYDGCLGVLGGLEVVETLNETGITTKRPLAVTFFTNEEGARFAPDMMGSAVHQGFLDLDKALGLTSIEGDRVGDALEQIGYRGDAETGQLRAHCYIELHIEQGPVLDAAGITIGVVEKVQGISWSELTIEGVSNHAGTTPMQLRCDAGVVASRVAVEAREMAERMGGDQVATVGVIELEPNQVNVIPRRAVMTVDLRNTDERLLKDAESHLFAFAESAAQEEGAVLEKRTLARFEPVLFNQQMVDAVERNAKQLGYSTRRLPSGAGHDAQMVAPNCPTAMIFVPSKDGISHNIEEFTTPEDIEAGANVLLHVVLEKAGGGQ
ncbi:MAG: Zn-dependent hydrolase [Arenicellales bacterium]|jgi:N-carbamoyl-L-amino-acid hydrolase|nr:Zn-dependent hydrolase [Arenicellales bacterium]MDP7481674.1 Zn-dependent hydrolase [Arenicellales bacterium]